MSNAELVKELSQLVNFIWDGKSGLSLEEAKNLSENIYNAISQVLYEEKPNEDVQKLGEILENIPFPLEPFCKQAFLCLSNYCADKLSYYEENDLVKEIEIKNKLLGYQDFARSAYHRRYDAPSTRFSGKGVVYTVITGGYDNIKEPQIDTESSGLEYFLLTDKYPEGYSGKWNVRVIDNPDNLSPLRFSRWLKMHPHLLFPEYDYSVYVDGKLEIRRDPKELLQIYGKASGMLCFPHYESSSIEEEAAAIISNQKGSPEELDKQIETYKSEGYAGKGFVTDNACLIRDHRDEALQKVMEDWWLEYQKYDHGRDQMSFDYACWKNSYDYDICDMLIYFNPWFISRTLH